MNDWTALVLLGAYHGINPGMGWLFAVALGMQRGSARGVWLAVLPIAAGHAGAVAMVITAAIVAQRIVDPAIVRSASAVVLIALGAYMLWQHPRVRYGGMVVGFGDLTAWSFLMASAHGAGLMVLPFVLDGSVPATAASMSHSAHDHAHAHTILPAIVTAGVHTLSYFAVMATVAWVVYRKVGLALLRTAWFDMERLWAAALLVTGAVILFA